MPFEPTLEDFETRVRASFARQRFLVSLGARLARVAPGEAEIELPFRGDLGQQHGFLHAGVIATIADTACGCAALTLMEADVAVLSVEFKLNLMAPAIGERFRARARVLKAGRTLFVCSADVTAVREGNETPVATMLGTMMGVRDRPGLSD